MPTDWLMAAEAACQGAPSSVARHECKFAVEGFEWGHSVFSRLAVSGAQAWNRPA